jgi:hypothetical protein
VTVHKHIQIFFALVLLGASAQADEPSAFVSDGCSLVPDASLIGDSDWCSCCYVHDIAYWMGGTTEQRLAADIALEVCVTEASDSETLANVMYQGVRLGGSPYLDTPFRWGFGWSYARKYQSLTLPEQSRLDTLMAEDHHSAPVCK